MSRAFVADTLRRLYPRVVAKTLGLTRSLPDAEDAVQDAIERALTTWPERGAPDNAEAWLLTVAANAYRDRLRRGRREEPREDALEVLSQMSPWAQVALGEVEIARGWKDELLRLLFACCHPALEVGEGAALALSTVIGLSGSEVARAFLTPLRSMEQRLTRARQRLRERGDCEGARPAEAHERLDPVLRVIHLLFNEGYWSGSSDEPIRSELCRLAVGLSKSLAEAFPNEPEVAGLVALLSLHDARRHARVDDAGLAVPLPEQDRTRWDQQAIAGATALLERALAEQKPGAFQIEAAISAVHCRARTAEETDWAEIAALYALLETLRPIPAVRVNRAFAVARASGAMLGLSLLDDTTIIDASTYPYVHLVRGALLEELGRIEEARDSLQLALQNARNPAERQQLSARLDRLSRSNEGDNDS